MGPNFTRSYKLFVRREGDRSDIIVMAYKMALGVGGRIVDNSHGSSVEGNSLVSKHLQVVA